MDRGQAARPRKPHSGHADTISTTVRPRRTNWNAMKPRIQCAPTQWNHGSSASGLRPAGVEQAPAVRQGAASRPRSSARPENSPRPEKLTPPQSSPRPKSSPRPENSACLIQPLPLFGREREVHRAQALLELRHRGRSDQRNHR
jgi:hypothetical protein